MPRFYTYSYPNSAHFSVIDKENKKKNFCLTCSAYISTYNKYVTVNGGKSLDPITLEMLGEFILNNKNDMYLHSPEMKEKIRQLVIDISLDI
jgi:hypothetical protein